ncbi:MAG: hypothetical protein NT007_07140 [Candidatus Kapabacteria bacterium]|nr:hypothetical protein [Candidatus Kapabacteria bacterium]
MKTRNIHVSVIPTNAGIPFHGAIGESCIRRNDRLKIKGNPAFAGMTGNNFFEQPNKN